jgi:hypothetical protein
MGHYNAQNNNQIVQSLPGDDLGMWNSPTWWNNRVYFGGTGDVLKVSSLNTTTGLLTTTPTSQTSNVFSVSDAIRVGPGQFQLQDHDRSGSLCLRCNKSGNRALHQPPQVRARQPRWCSKVRCAHARQRQGVRGDTDEAERVRLAYLADRRGHAGPGSWNRQSRGRTGSQGDFLRSRPDSVTPDNRPGRRASQASPNPPLG